MRAPFAAGALTLLAVWLLVQPSLPKSADAKGLYRSLVQLRGVLSAVGPTAIIAFAAYLVGSLVTTATEFVAASMFGLRAGWLSRRADGFGEEQALTLLDQIPEGDSRDSLERRCTRLYSPDAGTRIQRLRSIQQEWRLVRLRLLRELPEVFAEVDRLDSEGEFRRALIGPVVLLGASVAVRVGGGLGLLAAGIGLVGALLLYIAAWQATVEAEQAVADIVVDGAVTLPIIAALEAAARADTGADRPLPAPSG